MLEPPQSLWWDSLPEAVVARDPLQRHLDVDVAIVGGGFTGLWTARELQRRDQSLRIAIVEQSVCGYGASGRNGGWASSLYPVEDEIVLHRYGRGALDHLRTTLRRAVTDLGAAASSDGIDAHFHQGGSLVFARSTLQRTRLQHHVNAARELGVSENDFRWLDGDEARQRAALSDVEGATYSPHCARIHPARLVRGLAQVVEDNGAAIFEGTRVTRIQPRDGRRRPTVITSGATVHADMIVRATEGFTASLPGQRRKWAPLFSLMIATEPLSDSFWSRAGLRDFETFADDRHLIIYGQRTKDNRIAFGGRGAPYHFGSTVEPRNSVNERVFGLLTATLRELFPELTGDVTHQWGGPLAMPRDLSPSVVVNAASGLAHAGGYTGDGVVLSRVAAQAVADLIVSPDTETDFSTLPFVDRTSRRWELEPLRWLGINAGLQLAALADRHERRSGGASASRMSNLLATLRSTPPR